MGLIDDPISGVLGVFMKKAMDSKIMQYAVLCLEMQIASTIAGLAACGGALMLKQPVSWSMGCGMVAAALAMLATFGKSPRSKGLVISLPEETVDDMNKTPMDTIDREKA